MANGKKIAVYAVICGIYLWIFGFGLFVYKTTYRHFDHDKVLNPESEIVYCHSKGEHLSRGFWQRVNLHKLTIPESLKESLPMIKVETGSVTYKGSKVHYLHAKPKQFNASIPVLLLHGQAFTSETWNELKTIKILAALGYYPIAVDLPGFGQTPGIPDLNKSDFIHNLIALLKLKKPVLISPSMSGSFSLRYLIEHPKELGGFIPVSPVHTSILNGDPCKHTLDNIKKSLNEDCQRVMHYLKKFDNVNLNCIKVPTLVVWGEKDRGENSAKLCNLPESQGAEIPDGQHPAYLSNPDLWHRLLYNFLNTLNETRSCM